MLWNLLLLPHVVSSAPDEPARCSSWALAGECTRNRKYMEMSCPRACEEAADPSAEQCIRWAVDGGCATNAAYMRERCTEQCTCEARAAQGECGQPLAGTATELELTEFTRRCIHALELQGCRELAAGAEKLLQQ